MNDFTDYLEQKKKKEEWEKKHKILSFFEQCYWYIRYGIWNEAGEAYREIKWGFQRMFRGYDDTAYWSLYSYITDISLPVLKWMKENGHSIGTIEGSKEGTFEEQELAWYNTLDKMINSFQLLKDDNTDCEMHDKEWYQKQHKDVQEGLELFAKYFQTLWD
jgi:hypothetical protein